MSGIVGIASLGPRGGQADPVRLRGILNRMVRTLGDGEGWRTDTHVDTRLGLAVARTGPVHVHTAGWPIRLDGTDVFATGYPRGTAGRLGGFYSAVLVGPGGEVSLQTDRTSSRRLFYGIWDNRLHVASEVKALLAAGAPRALDPAAMATFLSTGWLFLDQTLFSGIRRLPVGSRLRLGPDGVRLERHSHFRPGAYAEDRADPDDLADELADLVRSAARANLDDPASTVIFLSGGQDSRGILAATAVAAGADARRLMTATWREVEGGPRSDGHIARELAAAAGVRHRVYRSSFDGFGSKFERVNALLDGTSEMAAQHVDELRIIEAIAEAGALRCFRGDEAFGWDEVSTLEQAWRVCGLRRLREEPLVRELIAQTERETLIEASESVFDDIRQRCDGLTPSQARDTLYFEARLPGYLGSAAHWRQSVLDERNILLEDDILDFASRTPDRLRTDKVLYGRALRRLCRDLPDIPFASESNSADWRDRLAPATDAGAYFRAQIADSESGIWRHVDRAAAERLIARFDAAPQPVARPAARAFGMAKRAVKALDPGIARSLNLRLKKARGDVPAELLLRRIVVLKDWHDRYVADREPAAAEPTGFETGIGGRP